MSTGIIAYTVNVVNSLLAKIDSADVEKSCGRMYRSGANQSYNANAYTKVIFDNEDFSTHAGLVDITNSRFICKVAGKHRMSTMVYLSGTDTGNNIIAIYKNGTRVRRRRFPGHTSSFSYGISDLIDLEVGDYVEVYIYVAASGYILSGSNGIEEVCASIERV